MKRRVKGKKRRGSRKRKKRREQKKMKSREALLHRPSRPLAICKTKFVCNYLQVNHNISHFRPFELVAIYKTKFVNRKISHVFGDGQTDRRTDGRTDRRTDGRTDGHPNSIGPQLWGWGLKIGSTLNCKKSSIIAHKTVNKPAIFLSILRCA